MSAAGALDPQTAAKVGKLLGVKYIITGGIDKFAINTTRGGFGGIGGQLVQADATINVRFIDTTTAERVVSVSADAEVKKGGGFFRGNSLSRDAEWGLASEVIEKVAKDVVTKLVVPTTLARITPGSGIASGLEARIAKVDGDVSLGVQNALFAELLDHWGLSRPHVVAHDFGGATALRTHLLDGRDYASLTLIDPVAIRPWGSPFVAHVREHEAAFAGMPAYAHEAMLDAYLRTAIARPIPDVELAPYKQPWLDEEGRRAFYRQIAQMDMRFTDEVEGRYGELRCPVQVLWGAEDGWIPLQIGRRLAARLPEARFIEVPGAGHLVHEDSPEAIVAALADFPPLASEPSP